MNLQEIYDQLYNKLGKDAFGNVVTPESFNLALDYSNVEKLNDFLEVLEQDQELVDDIRPFVVTLGDSSSSPVYLDDYGYCNMPDDYVRYVHSSRMDFTNTDSGSNEVYRHIEMLTPKEFSYRLSTSLYSPTTSRPIITVQNDKFLVRPRGIDAISLTYVRMPITPVYDYDIDDTTFLPVFLPTGELHGSIPNTTVRPGFTAGDPSLSVELEWPEDVHDDFINLMYKYFTINLKDYNSLQTIEIEKGLP
jgi:hypothetical protein